MKALPDGWPRISATLCYDDARAAIDWLCRVVADLTWWFTQRITTGNPEWSKVRHKRDKSDHESS